MNKTNYIRAVLVVFWLLILTRIPSFMMNDLDAITVVSTAVELSFLIWGIVILRRNPQGGLRTDLTTSPLNRGKVTKIEQR
jgi:hypothetical protein